MDKKSSLIGKRAVKKKQLTVLGNAPEDVTGLESLLFSSESKISANPSHALFNNRRAMISPLHCPPDNAQRNQNKFIPSDLNENINLANISSPHLEGKPFRYSQNFRKYSYFLGKGNSASIK